MAPPSKLAELLTKEQLIASAKNIAPPLVAELFIKLQLIAVPPLKAPNSAKLLIKLHLTASPVKEP